MPLIFPSNTLSAAGFSVDNSCRFNGDAYVHKAVSAGNQRTFTYSFWTKRATLNNYDTFIGYAGSAGGEGGTPRGELIFVGDGDDTLRVGFNPSASSWSNYTVSDRVFRDPSAWYHIVLKVNTTSATEAERLKIFVNGVSQGLSGYPAQDFDTGFNVSGYVYHIGRSASGTDNFIKGYLAEAVFIDGTALDADSFGEFDEDSPTIWKPIDVSGLTAGTNGFYLDFEDSANLGNDAFGGTDLTEVSLDATDQATDTSTNNFCTMNPLVKGSYVTLTQGNCVTVGNTTVNNGNCGSTFQIPQSGKWYFEYKLIMDDQGNTYPNSGIKYDSTASQASMNGGWPADIFVYGSYGSILVYVRTGTNITSGDAYATNDIARFAIDQDNGAIYVSQNETWWTSGDPTSGASKTGAIFSYTVSTYPEMTMDANEYGNSETQWNFGGCAGFTVASANQDGNGYGNFEYAVPSGYYALCTKNLAEFG